QYLHTNHLSGYRRSHRRRTAVDQRYCSQLGLHDTLHREVFPRSAELSWSHSTDTMTVTSAHDQALLLELLARGCSEESTAIDLGLDSQLCVFAVELMSHLFTPLLGARVARGR